MLLKAILPRTRRSVLIVAGFISALSCFTYWTSKFQSRTINNLDKLTEVLQSLNLTDPSYTPEKGFTLEMFQRENLNEFTEVLQSLNVTDPANSPKKKFTQHSFQPVDNTNQTYVFSAHIDVLYRSSPVLRIVALSLTRRKGLRPLFCVMTNTQKIWLVKAEFNQIPDHHGYRFSAAFILCPLNANAAPSSVSIVSPVNQIIHNKLSVPPLHNNTEVTFTVCVAPLHSNYHDISQLIEFLEVNVILGANKFIFYNHSISARVSDILHEYTDKGLVEVIGWHLPFDAHTMAKGYSNVHYFGQMAAVNDCLYRNRYKTRYIVTVDMDEFMVPRLARNWLDLKTDLVRVYPSAGAFVFRTYFFFTFSSNHSSFYPQKALAEKYNTVTLLKTNRTWNTLPVNIRSKYLYDPKRVSCAGIHSVFALIKGFKSVNIEPDICAINHYRNAHAGPRQLGYVSDDHMHKYQDEIAKNLRRTEVFNKKSM